MSDVLTTGELQKARYKLITTVNEGVSELYDSSLPSGLWRNSWYGVEDVGEVYFRVNARKRYIQIGSANIEERLQGHGLFKAIVSLLVLKTDREMNRMFNLIKLENIHNPLVVCNFLCHYEEDWTILRCDLHGVRTIFLLRKGCEGDYNQGMFVN